ncbi:MAG: hypothetical protein IPK75_18850 [Acidobacteria bacterium]|nr:hypothetical protein [Acidobacteriota bacterium]
MPLTLATALLGLLDLGLGALDVWQRHGATVRDLATSGREPTDADFAVLKEIEDALLARINSDAPDAPEFRSAFPKGEQVGGPL